MFSATQNTVSREDALELRERIAALSERIVALAEAANIVAEAAAPFRAVQAANDAAFGASPEFKALERAAARLEAARLCAIREFNDARRELGGEDIAH